MLLQRAARPQSEKAPQPDLFRKPGLLTGLRRAVGMALLVATAWLTLAQEPFPRRVEAWLFAIIGSSYLASLIATFLLRRGRHLDIVAHGQIGADLLAATGLVYLTGGVESMFSILYPLAIVNGAIALGRRGAALAAAASSVLFCMLAWSTGAGFLQPVTLGRTPLPPRRPAFVMAANISAFLLTRGPAALLPPHLQGGRRRPAPSQPRPRALGGLHSPVGRPVG